MMIDLTSSKKHKTQAAVNMDKETGRKYEYQSVFPLNEHRFDLVTLPRIASNNK